MEAMYSSLGGLAEGEHYFLLSRPWCRLAELSGHRENEPENPFSGLCEKKQC